MAAPGRYGPAAGAALVCRLAAGRVVEPSVGSASTYENEVCVTTEMPPSAMVDVNVVVTFFDDAGVLVLLVDDATVGVAVDVSRVVPLDVAWAAEHVSKICPRSGDASPRFLRQRSTE